MTKAERNVIDVQVGRRVRMTRIFRNHTEVGVALCLGISEARYLDLEDGRERFSAVELKLLSKLFRVNPAFFFGDEGKPQPNPIDKPTPIHDFSIHDSVKFQPAGML